MIIRPCRRSGFTLVELLIVMGIIVLIASLAVMFLPTLDRNKGVPNAVTQLQGWINLSRQQALRDHNPRGIRLIHDGNGQCTSLQYIEQPEPVVPRGSGIYVQLSSAVPGSNPPVMGNFTWVTLYQGNTPMAWDGVNAGDFLELSGGPSGVAQITQVTTTTPPSVAQCTLYLDRVIDGIGPTLTNMTTGFRVIRSPRPLAGEALLQMHKDVYIDLTACYPCPLNLDPPIGPALNLTYAYPGYNGPPNESRKNWGPQPIPAPQPSPADVNYIDILFNSSGFVANAPTGRYIIAVRHKDRPNDIHFVTIYTRTGKITNHAVNDGIGSPYLFTQDGSSPGL